MTQATQIYRRRGGFALGLVAAGIATGIAPGALAATKTWVGTTASWNTAGNWNPSGVPGTTDDVAFSSGSAACTMDTSPRVASFTINGYTGTITPNAGTRLTVTGDFTQSSAATLVAPAWMSVGGTFSRTAGSFTQGTGTVFLTSSSNPSHRFVSTTFYKLSINDGLVAHWRLDDATWIDSSGGGSTLTAGATPVLTTTTAPLTFSNAGAVDLGRGDSLYNTGFPQILRNNDELTVSVWIKPGASYWDTGGCGGANPSAPTGSVGAEIIVLGSSGSEDFLIRVCRYAGTDNTNHVRFAVRTTSGGQSNCHSTASFPDSDWTHIAGTSTSSDGGTTYTRTIYVNGVAEVCGNTTAPEHTATAFRVGRHVGGSSTSYDYVGLIDDIRIYNRALSGTEISALYAGTNPATPTGPHNSSDALTVSNDLMIASRHLTLGSTTSVSGILNIAGGGGLNTSASALSTTGVATVSPGTLTIGSSATAATFSDNVTIGKAGTLAMNTAGGVMKMATGKTLTIDGTLQASNSPTIQASSGTYTFSVGSSATATPTLNLNGLVVKNTGASGMFINAITGAQTTITRFDNVTFNAGNTSSGSALLKVAGNSTYLTANGCTFDRNGMHNTSYNVSIVGDGDTTNGETRATFGNTTCEDTSSAAETCETKDLDDDNSPVNGVADAGCTSAGAGCGVVQFVQQAYTDGAGQVEGFPTPAFNWTTFTYWRTYVAYNNDSASTHRLYARNDASPGSAYTWDIPAGKGTFVGTPRWDAECSSNCGVEGNWTHYVYVLTSNGSVYKLTDNGSAFAVVSGWPYRNGDPSNNGTGTATATSPLVLDTSNIYWAGNDGDGNRKFFSLIRSSQTLNGTPRTMDADVYGAPAFEGTNVYVATNKIGANGKIYKLPADLSGAEVSFTQSTSNIASRLTVYAGSIYFAEDIGKVWKLTTAGATTWSYQDTGNGHPACTASSSCTVKSLYLNTKLSRVYYGDQDGHLYAVQFSSGVLGAPVTGYPVRPTGALTGSPYDPFVVAPLYLGGLPVGHASAGIVAAGSSSGKVFFIDQSTPATLIKMFHVGSAVSSISYETVTSSTGRFLISNAAGHTYYIDAADVPDPTPTVN